VVVCIGFRYLRLRLAPCNAIGSLAVVLTGAERCVPSLPQPPGKFVSMGWKMANTFKNAVKVYLCASSILI
jgi:hypothetical protein